jgi:simple sugar transport system permease protein
VAINMLAPGLALFACRLFFDGAAMSPIATKLPKILGETGLAGTPFANLNVNVTTVLALLFTVIMWFVLYKTKWGLRIRAVGEHPAAADTLGIDVYKVRYACVLLSGMLAGFGGAAMTIAIISQFTQTAISGHGFIAMAAVIFGKWTPFGAYGACLLFGFTQALVIMLGGGNFVVPSQILSMLPYAMTIVVLILFVGRSVAPKADGVPYIKGSR